ncbi:MAG: YcxB family protein [Chitinophagaceae bacterium]
MLIHFGYDKKQVIQALRYHFLTRPEIKVLFVVVNVFAIFSAVLFFLKRIQPISFLLFSLLWFLLMLVIWRLLPSGIYKRAHTFKDNFSMNITEQEVVLITERGQKEWHWSDFSSFVESPYFFHLYFDSRSFFLVPKDAFSDLTSLQEARNILRNNIKK